MRGRVIAADICAAVGIVDIGILDQIAVGIAAARITAGVAAGVTAGCCVTVAVSAGGPQNCGTADNGGCGCATTTDDTTQERRGQHGNFFIGIARRHHFGAAQEDEIIRRAPLAPLFGWSVLRVELARTCIHKGHFVQIAICRDEQTVRCAGCVEVIVDGDLATIRQRNHQIIAVTLLRLQVDLP